MSDSDIIFNLRERRKRLILLEGAQTKYEAKELVTRERFYVETLLDYREKHGNLVGVITDLPSDVTPLRLRA